MLPRALFASRELRGRENTGLCSEHRCNMLWFGVEQPFPCVLPRQLGIYSLGRAAVWLGCKAWVNPDIDLPLLQSTSLTPPMAFHTQEAINSNTNIASPSCLCAHVQTKVCLGKVTIFLGFSLGPVLGCSLCPAAFHHCCASIPQVCVHGRSFIADTDAGCFPHHVPHHGTLPLVSIPVFFQDLLHPGKAPSSYSTDPTDLSTRPGICHGTMIHLFKNPPQIPEG